MPGIGLPCTGAACLVPDIEETRPDLCGDSRGPVAWKLAEIRAAGRTGQRCVPGWGRAREIGHPWGTQGGVRPGPSRPPVARAAGSAPQGLRGQSPLHPTVPVKRGTVPVSEQPAHVGPHLVVPVGPVVAALRSPVVERVGDALAAQDVGEMVGGPAVLPRPAARDDVDVRSSGTGGSTTGPRGWRGSRRGC